MPKKHIVTLHHVITMYNDMIDHMDGVMRALVKKKTRWKPDLFFAVKLARQQLSEYYAKLTSTTGILLMSAHILDRFPELRLFRKWNKGMDINPEDETCYTTQSKEALLKYEANEYCAKLLRLSNSYGSWVMRYHSRMILGGRGIGFINQKPTLSPHQ